MICALKQIIHGKWKQMKPFVIFQWLSKWPSIEKCLCYSENCELPKNTDSLAQSILSDLETQEVRPSNLHFNKKSPWFWYTPKFKYHLNTTDYIFSSHWEFVWKKSVISVPKISSDTFIFKNVKWLLISV